MAYNDAHFDVSHFENYLKNTMEDQIIKEGDTIIFGDVLGDRQSIITLRGKVRIKLGKAFYPADPIIGCNYGTLFTISADGKSLEKTHHSPSGEWNENVEVTRNNAKLLDANATNQPIQQAEILAMKQAGKHGKEIVDALTNNSATFQTKSEFAQEKYKKRKAKKYVQLACAKRPTAASICDTLFNKQPARIGYLRPDAVGILLHMANVGPGSKILVLENCGGMITGAVAERMGGYGSVCATYLEPHAKGIEIVKSFNFTSGIRGTVSRAPLVGLLKTRRDQLEKEKEQKVAEDEGTEYMLVDSSLQSPPPAAATEAAADTPSGNGEVVVEKNSKDTGSEKPPFSGCILCNPILHPKIALNALFPLLSPSASFAVWSQTLQPLADTMNELRRTGNAVSLMVQETWYRKQQVLPKRTHPTMSMNHGGGYLLSGIVTVAGTNVPLAPLPLSSG
ncbi:hypothetical protein Ndes2437B_g01989 [Nannochloris sp. 'desiccata']